MNGFFTSSELWSNIIGGIVAAIIFALLAYLWDYRKQRLYKQLTDIMGKAIQHRNVGEHKKFDNANEWVQKAINIEEEAVTKAYKLSPAAGALVKWLDRVPTWNVNSEVDRYVSILSIVIERIRELLERNS